MQLDMEPLLEHREGALLWPISFVSVPTFELSLEDLGKDQLKHGLG
mgnify:CR=1 FL=1